MTEEEKYDWIEKYLAGDLSGAELEKFKEQLEDPLFREEVRLHQELAEAVDEEDVAALEGNLSKIIREERKNEARTILFLRRGLMLAAGVLILILAGIFLSRNFLNNPSADRLYSTYIKELPTDLRNDINLRSREGDTGTDRSPIDEAFYEAYAQGNYAEALSVLQALPERDSTLLDRIPGTYHYLRGLTLLQMDRFPSAIQSFEKVTTGQQTEKAAWFKALALLKTEGFSDNAREAFGAIAGSSNPENDKARKILSEFPEE